jgi:hypothetical protein
MDRTLVVDVTQAAREAGLPYHVAITRAAWDRLIVEPRAPLDAAQQTCERYRLWRLLFDLRAGNTVYEYGCILDTIRSTRPDGQPLITLQLGEETLADFRRSDFRLLRDDDES